MMKVAFGEGIEPLDHTIHVLGPGGGWHGRSSWVCFNRLGTNGIQDFFKIRPAIGRYPVLDPVNPVDICGGGIPGITGSEDRGEEQTDKRNPKDQVKLYTPIQNSLHGKSS